MTNRDCRAALAMTGGMVLFPLFVIANECEAISYLH
ncbi:hypothetical protein SCACP_32470 [Sporomusa carbonis]